MNLRPGRPLDLSPTQIKTRRRRNDLALELPSSRSDVARNEAEEVLLTLATLNGHVNSMMAVRIVGTRATAAAWQVRALDSDQHAAIIAFAEAPVG